MKAETKKECKYPKEALLKSRAFSGYQPDFARAVLTEDSYTAGEAKALLGRFFGKEVK